MRENKGTLLRVYSNNKGNKEKRKILSDHEISAMEDIKREGVFSENFLDIGCGKGNLVFELSKIGKECVGLDISKADITCSARKARKTKVHFVLADATRLPFRNDAFKVITAIDVIEHLSNYEEFICECKRVLKNDGLIYIHTPNRLQTNLRKKLTR
jgi:ubiquinone/menaquinone biosynthesis C-methylase UbiE